MQYQNIRKAIFLERPNRFIAHVELGGSVVKAHVKNTGRCRELLVPGAVVYVEDFEGRMGSRKLQYSLIAVEKQNILINMDSQAPNKVTAEALQNGHLKFPGMDAAVINASFRSFLVNFSSGIFALLLVYFLFSFRKINYI